MEAFIMPRSMSEREYTFSVVMAVYKVEPYLAEAIESLISQDIGFSEHIQLILVDDGSPDGSGKICDEYVRKYPDNIMVLHKENGGVSSARNLGLRYIRGKYVNFMDSDDILSPNTMSDVAIYFDIWGDKTDIISIPFEFFERLTGRNIPHNRKFNEGNRVIDLLQEYTAFQFSLGAAFIKRSAISEMHFDESLILSEDAKELYKLFLNKPTIGVVDTATYFYRKRFSEGSAIDGSTKNPTCYTHHLRQHYLFMINNYIDHMGYLPRFVQYAVMYDLQWKFRQAEIPEGVLTDDEINEYLELRRELLKYIDDEIIWSMLDLAPAYRLFVMREKYGEDCSARTADGKLTLYYTVPERENAPARDITVYEFPRDMRARLDTFEYLNKTLYIEGSLTLPAQEACNNTAVLIKVAGHIVKCRVFERSRLACCGVPVERCLGFSAAVALDPSVEQYSLIFYANYGNEILKLTAMVPGDLTPLTASLENAFYFEDDRVFKYRGGVIEASLCGKRGLIERERALQKEIKKKGFYKWKKINKLRTKARLYKLLHKKPVWLISDRQTGADDNGEAFFRFMKKNKKVKSYFVIGKEHKKLGRRLGRTLVIGSSKHQLYSLIADRVISSQAENATLRITEFNTNTVKDLYSPLRYVFLQHGVTINDLSANLNKPMRGISLFITSVERERESIATDSYGYKASEVPLTGFARFDRLYNDDKKIISFMPTWRNYLAGKYDSATGTWTIARGAEESEYFKFYNALLSDGRLIKAAAEYGYKLALVPHPNLRGFLDCFTFDRSRVDIVTDIPYRRMFAESSLIMTDYSSAVYDFALLKKPILYCQFDKARFYSGSHTVAKGYFDFERDGFGEVTYELDETVELLIEYMKGGCKMKPEYLKRVEGFFSFGTEGNCQRIYDAIVEQKPIEK